MKKIIVTIVTVLVGIGGMQTVLAEKEDGHRGNRERHHRGMQEMGFRDPSRMIERMSRYLELDDLQQQKLNNVMVAAKPEVDELRRRAESNRESMRVLDVSDPEYSSKLTELAAEKGEIATSSTLLKGRIRAEINNELTDEQRQMLKKRGEGRRHRSDERPKAE